MKRHASGADKMYMIRNKGKTTSPILYTIRVSWPAAKCRAPEKFILSTSHVALGTKATDPAPHAAIERQAA
jgi:hypothetical protein